MAGSWYTCGGSGVPVVVLVYLWWFWCSCDNFGFPEVTLGLRKATKIKNG